MSLGVALAGGGLKGLAHIGALKALEDLGMTVNYLAGTSSGSLFATLYALGYSIDEIKEDSIAQYKMLSTVNKKPVLKAGFSYLSSGVVAIDGLIDGKKVEDLVNSYAKEKNIENMNQIKIPYAIATVDTISTKECIFLSKKYELKNDDIDYIYDAPVGLATRASMAFPGIFTPCDYGKYNFIDGGTKDNLPVQVLKDMGATKTLGLSFKIDEYEPKKDLMAILLRTVDIFSLKDVRKAQSIADLAIEIDCKGTSLLEIDNIDKVLKTGYDTIMSHKEEILALKE
ncbi:MAG: patatin-like phospholipase family protein [Clostridia bacterium]|nr:patatin-like phospholipase family protein [Clostridia bacterium]